MALPSSKIQVPSHRTKSKSFNRHFTSDIINHLYVYRRAIPDCTLNLDNNFSRFCPPEKKVKNARLAVLDNFKEISRIMTQNFLTHKRLEKRYEKTAIPKSELAKMREEENA